MAVDVPDSVADNAARRPGPGGSAAFAARRSRRFGDTGRSGRFADTRRGDIPLAEFYRNIARYHTVHITMYARCGWFTIAPMLQDLDQLAARIGQLVQRTRQLHSERDALRSRLAQAEQESRKLRERCDEADARLQALQERLQTNDSELAARLAQSEEAQATLREELERQAQQRQALENQLAEQESAWQARLNARETDLQRLRVAAVAARERIDAVLARLPGAPVEEHQ